MVLADDTQIRCDKLLRTININIIRIHFIRIVENLCERPFGVWRCYFCIRFVSLKAQSIDIINFDLVQWSIIIIRMTAFICLLFKKRLRISFQMGNALIFHTFRHGHTTARNKNSVHWFQATDFGSANDLKSCRFCLRSNRSGVDIDWRWARKERNRKRSAGKQERDETTK